MKFTKKSFGFSLLALALAAAGCTSTKKHGGEAAPSLTTQSPEASLEESLNRSAVYFDFDKYNIRENQRETADTVARLTKELFSMAPASGIRVEGNCDERGSAEYNMALGSRRADSLKSYLTAHGVDGSRVSTMSYGLEKASRNAHSESVWQHDRRDDVVVMSSH